MFMYRPTIKKNNSLDKIFEFCLGSYIFVFDVSFVYGCVSVLDSVYCFVLRHTRVAYVPHVFELFKNAIDMNQYC